MPQPQSQRVHGLDLDAPAEIEALFYTYHAPHPAAQPRYDRNRKVFEIPGGTVVNFDTYFSTFPESVWLQYTPATEFELNLTLAGRGVVSLFRQTPLGDVYRIARTTVDGDGETPVSIPVPTSEPFQMDRGRVWFELASDGDVVLHDGAWHTTAEPQRDCRLGVVICTFNRPEFVRRTVATLATSGRVLDEIAKIVVVNQGDHVDDLRNIVAGYAPRALDKFEVIEQANFGGCGGFTRGMHEVASSADCTHTLIMDDDVVVRPSAIDRVISLFRNSHPELIIGGQMLDLHRPNYLFEAGAMVHGHELGPEPLHRGLFVGGIEGRSQFCKQEPVDYNGWWFFAMPNEVYKAHRPMPCFIRGDDIEYGLRLQAHGHQSVPVPGIAVWHEPIYVKTTVWQEYFDLRNRLAIAAFHGPSDWDGLRTQIRFFFAHFLDTARYDRCALMLQAMHDYHELTPDRFGTQPTDLAMCHEVIGEFAPEHADTIGRELLFIDDTHPDPEDVVDRDTFACRDPKGGYLVHTRNESIESGLIALLDKALDRLGPNAALSGQLASAEDVWAEHWDKLFAGGEDASPTRQAVIGDQLAATSEAERAPHSRQSLRAHVDGIEDPSAEPQGVASAEPEPQQTADDSQVRAVSATVSSLARSMRDRLGR